MNEKNLQDKTNSMMWSACDTLRTSIPGANYKDYALTILFVKYLSDTYKYEKEQAERKYNGNKIMIDRYLGRLNFKLEDNCTFDYLYDHRNDDNIGEIINKALESISKLNGTKLLNMFDGVDFNSETTFGKKKEKNSKIRPLLNTFNKKE